ncbi:hypothetical protein ATO7_14083 [Oceanococcus atlanticus]|uniref:Lipoprotein n=1 Tax=Oceanococcus atlanticus TaxID=1317117 RepID=A0A1Y1SCS9_9GAMM|nr:DUF3015 family protein [Oceanococcus atlanticus]ORE86432.1 hypothetical protein ATO7_14083 [Oceanococcus atlanticus]
MKQLALAALASCTLALVACSTTDAVSLPFDLASTTGDGATSTSSSSEGDGGSTQARMKQERYVATQIDWIRRDAARGEGESLAALAELLNENDSAEFSRWTQQNYALLFANLEQPTDLLQRIHSLRN